MIKRTNSASDYQVLSEREHIRKRVGMYAGQVAPHTDNEYVFNSVSNKMENRKITYIPALIKIFSEIVDNAIDEYKRHPNVLNAIRVEISKNEISVSDNGAGIPVELHPATGQYVPETVFTNLRAGSNFNDDEERMTIGTNGVGSSICVILSSVFKVETCDGKNKFIQEYLDGLAERTQPKIKPSDKHGTKVTFVPDFKYFGITELDNDHIDKMTKRVVDLAGCNPQIKFYINGERITFKAFDDYVSTYQDEFVFEHYDDWEIAVAHSQSEQFEQISFVNAVETYNGGTHVDYVFNQIAGKLKEFFKKKHKVDITFGMLKNHIRLFISCNIDKPKFNSQTKDCMVSEIKNFGTSCEISDKLVRKITQSHIIQSVLDWVAAKAQAAQMAELRKINKNVDKADPRKVEKFSDANEKRDRHKCVLLFTEGDSAAKSVQSGRGKSPYIGSFPLKGKPLNVSDVDPKKILENEEIKKILTITGLKLGEKVTSVAQLRFGKFGFTTDADVDGAHIQGLLNNLFYRFWPELFELGVIHIFRTPLIKVFIKGKKDLWFYTEREFKDWEASEGQKTRSWTFKYFKGLGTSTSKEFAEYLSDLDTHLVRISIETNEDRDMLDLAFNGQRADDRKAWLETGAEAFEF